ncbi:TMEM175 family protein, partial [Micromonospora sp. NPDC049891]|uniref:TMEM175 family protein n=1 Tax=Micromonospora sp. NPDC049891 TaxID=3155655 RepID=UPI0033D446BA
MSEPETATGTPPVSDIGRMTGFSDGVFAIVITLLVVELQVPEHRPGELLHALLEQASVYLAFLLSFGYVGVLWLNHHTLLRLIRGTIRATLMKLTVPQINAVAADLDIT